MGSINVNQNVFQAVKNATNDTTLGGFLGKPDINASEMAQIEQAIGADGKVDEGEKKLLEALKNKTAFSMASGAETTSVNPTNVTFPETSAVTKAQENLKTIVRYGNGNQANLGPVSKETYKTHMEVNWFI